MCVCVCIYIYMQASYKINGLFGDCRLHFVCLTLRGEGMYTHDHTRDVTSTHVTSQAHT